MSTTAEQTDVKKRELLGRFVAHLKRTVEDLRDHMQKSELSTELEGVRDSLFAAGAVFHGLAEHLDDQDFRDAAEVLTNTLSLAELFEDED